MLQHLLWKNSYFFPDITDYDIHCHEDIQLAYMKVTYDKHYNGTLLNMTAHFECVTGYTLVGPRQVHCAQSNRWPDVGSVWNESFPYCIRKIRLLIY